ncbi:MAG: hypothetical protein Ta2D_13870 [Rickettsiales bacterium]|nr:MAG: hypothetical protein Ta2D_13870 [Rickettsiales bacterium]
MIFETIRKRADILKSRKNAISTIKGKYIFIVFSANEFEKTRFLAVVTKKINKRAVVRNRFKRQIKEIFRQNELLNGYDYQIIAKKRNPQRNILGNKDRH